MLLAIWDDVQLLKNGDLSRMPHDQIPATLDAVFPEWFKTVVMLTIAMISNGIVSLAKSKLAGTFVFSVWLINIALALVIAFLVDNIALWIEPAMNIRAESALMVLTGMLTKDILELAEKKGLSWIRWKSEEAPSPEDKK